MSGMFRECRNLKQLDVSRFNTANVTTMEEMFYCCESLTQLNVSNFNTANVVYERYVRTVRKSYTVKCTKL